MWYSRGVEGGALSSLFFSFMTQFRITYGVGGGYNDISTEIIEADMLNDA